MYLILLSIESRLIRSLTATYTLGNSKLCMDHSNKIKVPDPVVKDLKDLFYRTYTLHICLFSSDFDIAFVMLQI